MFLRFSRQQSNTEKTLEQVQEKLAPRATINYMSDNLFALDRFVQFLETLRPSDFFDIIIFALFIYALFLFFRRARTYLVFWGIGITIAIYFLAQTFNLYLTFLTLRYVAGVSLILFAIVFQAEIRKYIEVLGLIGSRQAKVGKNLAESPDTAELIQACVQMAKAKIGAIIVIHAETDLTNYLDGGIPLDGVISEEVITSIFDPHSSGHDGALVIKNNRIVKFGTQLPLSTNFSELGKHGTRHSAALALSELTDAICIVCSEEKGTISIARDGKLKTLTKYDELLKELNKYFKKALPATENLITHAVKHNSRLKVLALLVSAVIWFFIAYQAGIVEKTYKVPITVENLPQSIQIDEYSPKEVTLLVRGRGKTAFAGKTVTDFSVTIDGSELKEGTNSRALNRKDVTLPPNLLLLSYSPDTILISSKHYFTATVPVKADIKGALSSKLLIGSIAIIPGQIEILVPDGVTAPTEIMTEVIDLTKLTETLVKPIAIVTPKGVRTIGELKTVNIAITVEQK